jgi:hypothetical protein
VPAFLEVDQQTYTRNNHRHSRSSREDAIGEKLQNVDKMITCLQELKKQLEEASEYQIE